jgi:glycine cleavage system H protein
MSEIPDELRYTAEHEWLRLLPDGTAQVGITDHAQASLGDITFVELPEVGATLAAGQNFGVVESVKAASDVYMPVAGEVLEVNPALADAPETVNQSPYGDAWLIRIRPAAADAAAGLMDAAAYQALVG